jgi:hypothetical protein
MNRSSKFYSLSISHDSSLCPLFAHYLILALSSLTRTLQRVTATTKPALTVHLAAYRLYSIVEEGVKLFKYSHVVSVALDPALELLEALLNGIVVGRVWRQVLQYYASCLTKLPYSRRAVDRRVIKYDYRVGRWVRVTERQHLVL